MSSSHVPGQAACASILCYQIFGRRLESDCPLPELLPDADVPSPAITVRALAQPAGPVAPIAWFREWYARDGRLNLRAGRSREGLILRFSENAEFLVAPSCTEIHYHRLRPSADTAFRHALLDQVVPRTLAQGGRLVLHASSVTTQSGAVCLIGHPGQGKSTLAAAFHREGARLLADDASLIDAGDTGVYCAPGYPGVRLWPDAAERLSPAPPSRKPVGYRADKLRCCLDQCSEVPPLPGQTPVRAILSLQRRSPDAGTQRTVLERLAGTAATIELMQHAFKFDIGDRAHLSRLLGQSARVATAVPVYRVTYPSDLALLPRVCAQIVHALG